MNAMATTVAAILTLAAAGAIGYARLSQPAGTPGSPGAKTTTDGQESKKEAAVTTTMPDAKTRVLSRSGYDITPLKPDRIEELAKGLNDEERKVILRKGTEAPFCGNLLDNKKEGTYHCRLCALPLFTSDTKFNSGTGWPSFFKPVDGAHIREIRDTSHGMIRTEITCGRCDGHLGHVFNDAPQTPTGLRYCLNSVSMTFSEKGTQPPAGGAPIATKTAYFAGGCFWGVEDRFQRTPGVVNVVSGYMGGRTKNPTYRQVCYEDTGHAETVMVVYDPSTVAYRDLLEKFFKYHDPTQLNRQGPDVGTQYRSAIFTADEDQAKEAAAFITEAQQRPRFKDRRIVTQVLPAAQAGVFYPAEAYHQDYHEKNGGHCAMPEE